MALTRLEKISYVGGPWFFSVVLIVCGLFVSNANPAGLQGIILICAGLLAMSIYCVCVLLAKLIATQQ